MIARHLRQRRPLSPRSRRPYRLYPLSWRSVSAVALLPSLPPGIRVSRPHNFATLFLEKIGKVDPIPCPTFPGRRFDRPDVHWITKMIPGR